VIEYWNENILSAPVQAIVNPVNCVGVMGAGLARQIAQAFPEILPAYKDACRTGKIAPGKLFVHDVIRPDGRRGLVVDLPTKRHWKDPSHRADIEQGLAALVFEIHARKIETLAVPALGCGLGGLSWPTVQGLLEKTFVPLQNVRVFVCPPQNERRLSSELRR